MVRGSVFDADSPIGLYLIALHGHSPRGRLGHLAVALRPGTGGEAHPIAAALQVSATPEQFELSLIDWSESPWKSETSLGDMLDRAAALSSPLRADFLHVANHVVIQVPEVAACFA